MAVFLAILALPIPALGQQTIVWKEDFEDIEAVWDDWSVEGGAWEVGVPRSGPDRAISGSRLAGTVLGGNYAEGARARLMSFSFLVPEADQFPRLRWAQWYALNALDSGQVQVRVGNSAWTNYPNHPPLTGSGSGAWSLAEVDLRPYAGQRVRIGFLLSTERSSSTATVGPGWYIDDVQLVTGPPILNDPEGFEQGWGDWHVEGGSWEVGPPASGVGPGRARTGVRCAGTALGGNYADGYGNVRTSMGRLVSPEFLVPATDQFPRLRWGQWYALNALDTGQVQIKVGSGGWVNLPPFAALTGSGSGVWSMAEADLRAYAGQRIRIGFLLNTDRSTSTSTVGPGWYIDDVQLVTGPPILNNPEGFEQGWGDWHVEGGSWEVGAPARGVGPGRARTGVRCAGTALGGNYADGYGSVRSSMGRLVSPEFDIPAADLFPRLRWSHWYSFNSLDTGRLQIKVGNGAWMNFSGFTALTGSGSGVWSMVEADLRAYAGQRIRIGFLFTSDRATNTSTIGPGWYIDDVQLVTGTPILNDPEGFEQGWGDWHVEGGSWEVGPPASGVGPGRARTGVRCAGTALGGNYADGYGNVSSSMGRLVSPEFVVPAAHLFPRLRWGQWYAFNALDTGQVQIKVRTGGWVNLPPFAALTGSGSGVWSMAEADLRAYAGQRIRIGFLFTSDRSTSTSTVGPGWYIDDVQLVTGTPILNNPEGFEQGWGDWHVEGGSWEVGAPARGVGPGRARTGVRCAGTALGGNYADGYGNVRTSMGRLVSPEFEVPASDQFPRLRWGQWYSFNSLDTGRLQIKVGNGAWMNFSGFTALTGSASGVWSMAELDLGAYAGQRVRIGFLLNTDRSTSTSTVGPGWYIDDVRIQADVIDRIENRTVDEETLLVVPISVNGAVPLLRLAGDAPAGARMDSELGLFTWIPTEDQGPGVYSITIEAVDPANTLTPLHSRTFTVTVNEVNRPPIVDPIPAQAIEANVPLTFVVTAFDPDRPVIQTLSFSLDQGAPAGATIHPQTGVFSWTPTAEQAGLEHSITVRVTDNGDPPMSSTTTFSAAPLRPNGEVKLKMRAGAQGELRLQLDGATAGAEYTLETTIELKSPPEATQWTQIRTFRWEADAGGETIEPGLEQMQFYRVVSAP